jgi:hypothetical protein
MAPKDESLIQAPALQWDTETREGMAKKEGHIRDETIYLTSALLSWMESEWGGVLTHVKTSTDVATGEVSVFKAAQGEPGAVSLRRLGALNSGEFSFWRPLHKLSLKVPPNRQFNVTPFTRQAPGVGTLFVFPMNERVSVPRNRKEEKAAAEAAKQTTAQAAPSTEPANP